MLRVRRGNFANSSNSGTNDLARLKAHLSIRVDGKDRCSSHVHRKNVGCPHSILCIANKARLNRRQGRTFHTLSPPVVPLRA